MYKSFPKGSTKTAPFIKKSTFNSGAFIVINSPLVPCNGNSLKNGLALIPKPSQKTIFEALIFLYQTSFLQISNKLYSNSSSIIRFV